MHFLALLLFASPLLAQQTIFDVPSGDVSGRKAWFYQHQTVARTWNPGRTWIQSNAVGVGVGHALELDFTWFNVETKAVQESSPSVGFKWSPRLNRKDSRVPLRFVLGEMVQIRGRDPHAGHWTYAMMSAELPKSHTHLTGGYTAGSSALFGRRSSGLMAGIEQHLNHRWMLQADWFSGKHDLSYLIPGVVYRASDHWMISLGYQIPNPRSKGFGAVVFELTRFPSGD